jgi:hypothetical protein
MPVILVAGRNPHEAVVELVAISTSSASGEPDTATVWMEVASIVLVALRMVLFSKV